MQNKPNLLDTQINVTSVLIKNYEENRPPNSRKNKPKQTQFKPRSLLPEGSWRPKMNINTVIVLPVESSRLLAGKSLYPGAPGQSHTTLRSSASLRSTSSREFFTLKGITKEYENSRLAGCAENKPNQTQIFRSLPPKGRIVSPSRVFLPKGSGQFHRNMIIYRNKWSKYKGVSYDKNRNLFIAYMFNPDRSPMYRPRGIGISQSSRFRVAQHRMWSRFAGCFNRFLRFGRNDTAFLAWPIVSP